MPSIPFISGDDDPDKETWGEARARKKDERAARKEAQREERLARSAARKRGSNDSSADRMTRDEDFFDRNDPYDNRSQTSRSTRVANANPGPAGISPYADNRDLPRRAPASAVEMAPGSGEPQLRGQPMQRGVAEPMTAEEIGQMASISTNARRSTRPIGDLQPMLRNFDRIYTPRGVAPFPTVLFFHGCEGPTRSHESDWASFYTGMGYAMIAVDSISGREISWEDVCNMQNLNPAERAADVFATIDYVRGLPFVDSENLVITGFSTAQRQSGHLCYWHPVTCRRSAFATCRATVFMASGRPTCSMGPVSRPGLLMSRL